MRFVQLSDLHLVPRGQGLHGLDPVERLEAAIRDVNRQPDIEFAVLTGDLADHGDAPSYGLLKEMLEDLKVPAYPLIGNHDRREAFASVFGKELRDEGGFIQHALEREDGLFLFLDTVDEGKNPGAYCRARRKWLRKRLEKAGERPVYLFMHHPPFDVGFPSLDRMKLREPDNFATTIRKSPNLAHIFFGHVHRPISGVWRGVAYSALPGTNHQIATDFKAVSPMPYSHGPPAYAIVQLEGDRSMVHVHNYLDHYPRRMPDKSWIEGPDEEP
jgi:3',5'-cyclic AMP phosphodiesterase CpdA